MSFQITLSQIVGMALLVAVGCEKSTVTDPDEVASAIEPVEVVKVRASDLSLDVELPATVEGYEMAELMSKIDGYVEAVEVNIGDTVTKGDILAMLRVPELDDEVDRDREMIKQADAEIERLRAQVNLAKAQGEAQTATLKLRKAVLERFESLVSKGSLSPRKRDEAQFSLEAAEAAVHRCEADVEAAEAAVHAAIAKRGVVNAELKHTETMASYREIRAPFSGLITARMVDPGDFVRPATSDRGTPLFTMTRVDRVRLVFYMPMEKGRQLNVGDAVVFHNIQTMPNVEIETVDGQPLTVSRFSNAFDMGSRMMRAEVDIENAKLQKEQNAELKPGDYGKVTLQLHQYEQVPTVPLTAIGKRKDSGKQYVVHVDASDTCYEVPIRVLIEKDGLVGIASEDIGIGDTVVAEGMDRIEHKQTLSANQIKQADFKSSQ